MQESFFIIYPSGYIMDVGVTSPSNGLGNYGSTIVTQPLPGGNLEIMGLGEHSLSPGSISGKQGIIKVYFTTGTQGSARAVTFIALSSNLILGIALDNTNRPYAILVDSLGTTIGQSTPSGTAIPSGTPITAKLTWSSEGIVSNSLFASFEYNENTASWTTQPTKAWSFFVPSSVYVGTSLSGHGLSDFNGTIGKVLLSDFVVVIKPDQIIILPLDILPAPIFSTWSKKLETSYLGASFKGDNGSSQKDIHFTSAGLEDTQDLISFGGASDVGVATLYDQSKFGNDLTSTNQPLVYTASGGVELEGTTPVMFFDPSVTVKTLSRGDALGLSPDTAFTIAFKMRINPLVPATNPNLLSMGTVSNPELNLFFGTDGVLDGFDISNADGSLGLNWQLPTGNLTGWHSYVFTGASGGYDHLTWKLYIDGVDIGAPTLFTDGPLALGNEGTLLGDFFGGGFPFPGNLAGIIIWNTELNPTQLSLLQIFLDSQ